MKNIPEIILKMEEKTVVEEMTELLKQLSEEEQKQVSFMIRGLKIGMALKEVENSKSA